MKKKKEITVDALLGPQTFVLFDDGSLLIKRPGNGFIDEVYFGIPSPVVRALRKLLEDE